MPDSSPSSSTTPQARRSRRLPRLFLAALLVCVAYFLTVIYLDGRKQRAELAEFIASGVDTVTVHELNPKRIFPSYSFEDEKAELLLFNAQVSSGHFHQFPILRTVEPGQKAQQEELMQGVTKGLQAFVRQQESFAPRYGIRLTRGQEHFDMVLCMVCNRAEIWSKGSQGVLVKTSGEAEPLLLKLLESATERAEAPPSSATPTPTAQAQR